MKLFEFMKKVAGASLAAFVLVSSAHAATYLPIKVSAAPPPDGGSQSLLADWNTRKNAAGVTFASDFSGAGDFVLASTPGGHVFAPSMNPTLLANITKETSGCLTNSSCLKISTPAAMSQNGAAWMFPLNAAWTSNAQSFGLNTEWYIQYRFRIPSSRLVVSNTSGTPGWKFMNLAQYSPTNTDSQSFSNTTAEIVMQDTGQLGLPRMYHQDGASFPPFEGFAGGQVTLQPAVDKGSGFTGGNRYCHYPSGTPACFYWPTDEWVTVKVRVKIGAYNGSTGNEMDMWVARWQASSWTLLFSERNFTLGSPNSSGGGFTGLNGAHFLTYETNRTSSSVDTYQMYEQVIVSTQDIAIPQPLSPMGLLAYNMAPGTWAELTTASSQNAVLGVGPTSSSTIFYANSMPWNPIAKRIEILANDHNYHFPSVTPRYMYYDDATNAFVLGADVPSGAPVGVQHAYDHVTLNPTTGDVYYREYNTTGNYRKPNGSTTMSARASWDAHGWNQVAIGTAWWSESGFTGAGAQGSLIVYNCGKTVNGGNASDGQMTAYDPLLNSWFWDTSPTDAMAPFNDPGSSGATYHCLIEYSKAKNVAVYGGGNSNPNAIWRLNANRTKTQLTNVPSGKSLGVAAGNLVADPVSGNFLLLSNSQLWELDPTGSGTWTQQNGARAPPAGLGTPGTDGIVCTGVEDYGVIVCIKQSSASGGRIYLYKHQ